MRIWPARRMRSALNDDAASGLLFSVSHIYATVLPGSFGEILITTGAKKVNLNFTSSSTADHEVRLFTGLTITSPGTPLTVINADQTSGNTTVASFFHSPSISAVGPLLFEDLVPAGQLFSSGSFGSGEVRLAPQFVLAPSSSYLIQSTNSSGGAAPISFNLSLSEG